MMFGLKMVLATFQRIISKIFGEFIPTSMQVFLDNFVVYRRQVEHFDQLRLCLERCRQAQLNLNPTKCAFNVSRDALLGHIVSREGITMDQWTEMEEETYKALKLCCLMH